MNWYNTDCQSLKYKMHTLGKDIFREAMHEHGLVDYVAFRPKKAAQYGSRVSNVLKRVSKGSRKSDWLRARFKGCMPKLGILLSGGKDSMYAAYIMYTQSTRCTPRSRYNQKTSFRTCSNISVRP